MVVRDFTMHPLTGSGDGTIEGAEIGRSFFHTSYPQFAIEQNWREALEGGGDSESRFVGTYSSLAGAGDHPVFSALLAGDWPINQATRRRGRSGLSTMYAHAAVEGAEKKLTRKNKPIRLLKNRSNLSPHPRTPRVRAGRFVVPATIPYRQNPWAD